MNRTLTGLKNTIIILFLLMALFLQGCSGSSGTAQGENSAAKETLNRVKEDNKPLKLSIFLSDDNIVSVFKEYNKKFQEIHPNVEVDLTIVRFDIMSKKLQEMRDAGTNLDIIQLWPGDFKTLKNDPYVMDLDPFFRINNIDKNDVLFDGISKMMTVNGKLMGIPAYIDNLNIFYNKKWFEEANVKLPKDGWLWDDFVDTTKRLQAFKKDPLKYGAVIPFHMDFIEPFVMGKKASVFSVDGSTTKGYLDSKASEDAFNWVTNFIRVDKLSPIITGNESFKSIDLLKDNTAAMVMGWSSYSNYDKTIREGIKSGLYGIIGLPKFADGERVNTSMSFGLGISQKSTNQKLAWEYIQGLTIKPLQVTNTMSENGFIGTKALVDGLEKKEQDPNKQVIFGEFQYVKTNAYYKESDWWNIQGKTVNGILDAFIKGNDPVEQLLPKLSEAINLELGLKSKK